MSALFVRRAQGLGYKMRTSSTQKGSAELATQINKIKVLGELFQLRVMINDLKRGKEYRRFSPATKEVVEMLETSVKSCAEAVRNGHPLMFEINVWEQQSLTGFAINLSEDNHE